MRNSLETASSARVNFKVKLQARAPNPIINELFHRHFSGFFDSDLYRTIRNIYFQERPHRVHPPLCVRGGWLNLLRNFQKRGGLDRISTFRVGDFLQGGCNFCIKDKLKSEIFN